MTSGDALLQAICANPADDAPRLVYADWLDEHDQPDRAEFIRVQCEWARLADPGWRRSDDVLDEIDPPVRLAARRRALLRREEGLLAAHGEAWRQEVPAWARNECEFERGFIAQVKCSAADWLSRAGELVRCTPLQHLALEDCGRRMKNLAACPHLAQIVSLDLSDQDLTSAGVGQLARSPYLTRLRRLDLSFNEITAAGAKALARSPHLAGLEALLLQVNRVEDEGVDALAESTTLANLVELDLGGNGIGDEGAFTLAFGALDKLRILELYRNFISDPGVEALAQSENLAHLTKLELYDNEIGEDGARALAESPYLRSLAHLHLGNNLDIEEAIDLLRRRFGKAVHFESEED
jgi:uncharacterized protein (TIGR02996 family)